MDVEATRDRNERVMSLPDDLRDALAKYVDGLSEPEEEAVKLLFGFGIRRPLSMSEVAAQLDLPEAEVDRMRRRMLFHFGRTEHFDALPRIDIGHQGGSPPDRG